MYEVPNFKRTTTKTPTNSGSNIICKNNAKQFIWRVESKKRMRVSIIMENLNVNKKQRWTLLANSPQSSW